MALIIHLLGRPHIERDGVDGAQARGRKVWAVLAYLACAERPVSRGRLAGLLFGEANDPLGALRWNLAEIRRLLGIDEAVRGEGLWLGLPAGAVVDVRVVTRATWVEAVAVEGLGSELLEGMSFPANSGFDAWLSGERHHLAARSAGVLREATLGRLAVDDIAGAGDSARALVALEPLDEVAHGLLVRTLVARGDRTGAQAHVAWCAELLTRELGRPPSAAVAAELESQPPRASLARGATARALLDAGVAAVAAGATDVGLDRLREAAARGSAACDLEAEVAALCELGYSLVHAVRGRDEAGAVSLLQAIALADRAGQPDLAVAAHRELGYTAFLGARYEEAFRHLDRAEQLANPGGVEDAAIAAIRGACFTEIARYALAEAELGRAIDLARAVNASRWLVWSQTMTGRLRLLREETALARLALEDAVEVSRTIGWTSVLPWPEALLGEVDLLEGRLDAATDAASHAFALGCELRDPCWEETAGRVLALVAVAECRFRDATTVLLDARTRGSRVPDAWRFAHAQVLDALAGLGAHNPDQAIRWIVDLELVAGSGGMRELLVRAQLHRAVLGQLGAREAACALADGIDNPALTRLLTR